MPKKQKVQEQPSAAELRKPRPFRSMEEPRNELLALEASAFGMYFDPMGHDADPGPASGAETSIAIVSVCGPLEHHAGWWWDSYDAVICRLEEALQTGAQAVVMCFDSPGGDANGTTEAHKKIRALREEYGVPILGYSNENCYSAAYALASACDKIYVPETGGVGSVGVIASVVSQEKWNEKLGFDVRLITTGKRKADSHPDRPITSDIMKSMQARVDKFGESFFACVASGRAMSVEAVKELEAGIFLGQDAVDAGLADAVMGWDEFLAMVRGETPGAEMDPVSEEGETTMLTIAQAKADLEKAKAGMKAAKTEGDRAKAVEAIVKATENLVSAKAAKAPPPKAADSDKETEDDKAADSDKEAEEEEETEAAADSDSDDSDSDAESVDEDSDESKAADDSDDDGGDEEEEEEDEDEKAASAKVSRRASALAAAKGKLLKAKGTSRLSAVAAVKKAESRLSRAKAQHASLVSSSENRFASRLISKVAEVTGKSNRREMIGALDAVAQRIAGADNLRKRVAKLEGSTRKEKVDAMLKTARREGRIGRMQVETLKAQGMKDPKWLKGYLSTCPAKLRTEENVALPGGKGSPRASRSAMSEIDLEGGGDLLAALTPDQRKIVEASAKESGKDPQVVAREIIEKVQSKSTSALRH